ncbi:phosphoribosylglycinamide formyltransferase [Rhizosphaericola mali]|uniref:phosphoribosylglycinamide formyltransferase 1 n=1 Tax=Rhizosphaericola mali TaxID=2545455 RepID=A0A5P2G3R4_9BACT|nr:phosphoribosylglycinamide formyltransferase [Rhizosphaericola mali]QES90456.1 phosphoribosylglycinamide formyltransferase [Rhizosphaericola mali]
MKFIKLAILASGTGSNAANILSYLKNSESVSVGLIATNNSNAGVLEYAKAYNVPTLILESARFKKGDAYIPELEKFDYLILAGFLWKIPAKLVQAFSERIINIHPSLLPKYGGNGMYGHFVHEAVIANKESESGITIHLVDEVYDNGKHLFQAKCLVNEADTPESLAQKIHQLEHANFPEVILEYILSRN